MKDVKKSSSTFTTSVFLSLENVKKSSSTDTIHCSEITNKEVKKQLDINVPQSLESDGPNSIKTV